MAWALVVPRFGGVALGLPLMLFINDQPLFWLPVIGAHLLFFSTLTLHTRLSNVDWQYLKKAAIFIMPLAVIGVFGLITLPKQWMLIFIYSVSLFYALMWLLNLAISSQHGWSDKLLLCFGGYVAGASLTGAPLMVAVFMQNVAFSQLRNTLFVLWFSLVTLKMSTFVALNVALQLDSALLLLPAAAVGHVIGLSSHEYILKNDQRFKQIIGGVLVIISSLGLLNIML